MDIFRIQGGNRLSGSVKISGSKNGALPVLFASLLCDGPVELRNVPTQLRDIRTSLKILETLGAVSTVGDDGAVSLQVHDSSSTQADYELVRAMRASICCLGPLLARRGEAHVSLPGGCSIGDRPVELHTRGMEALGAQVSIENGYVVARADRLIGNTVYLSGPMGSTVLGTQNVMMAAVGAEGETVIEGAACEPEVQATAGFLRAMGVAIEGDGTPVIRIEGRGRLDQGGGLGGGSFGIPPDRIETGTYLLAGAVAADEVTVEGCNPSENLALLDLLERIGVSVEVGTSTMSVRGVESVSPVDVSMLPYPAFPTDLQGPLMALLCLGRGVSLITDKVFPDRFNHLSEMRRFGAKVRKEGPTAIIEGGAPLSGAQVMASDLRASACLVLAGLVADGETIVNRIYHLDRGYERMEQKLRMLGAQVERQSEKELEEDREMELAQG
ncbi:MAG: UDP-N-acetylglucosamine 1-carboxyvinyltransferase [Planctomycetota bacterium]|nr:UDP-N-acetylglucosamine 1-carboxyvinyltransferase [Planctomycetota bacterium]